MVLGTLKKSLYKYVFVSTLLGQYSIKILLLKPAVSILCACMHMYVCVF